MIRLSIDPRSLGILLAAVATLHLLPTEGPALGQEQVGLFVDLSDSTSILSGIPDNGTRWERYTPGPFASFVQEAYIDNGDGVMSVGDEVVLDGTQYPITEVGPAGYGEGWSHTTGQPDPWATFWGSFVLIPPSGFSPSPEPVTWYAYNLDGGEGSGAITLGWVDANADGRLSAGDVMMEASQSMMTRFFTIRLVTVAAQVADFGAVSVQATTWGQIKTQFK